MAPVVDRLKTEYEGVVEFRLINVETDTEGAQIANDFGVPSERGTVIDLTLTQQDLAKMIGATRETVSHCLARLLEYGAVRRRRAPITVRRCLSIMSGQTTMLATPVSSSTVMKQTPLAEPGRWRISTTPATWTIERNLRARRSQARTKPRSASDARRKAIGWAFRESRCVW